MRVVVPVFAVLLVAACEPPIPDSRPAGVGFGNYSDYHQQQIAAAQPQSAMVPQGPIVPPENYAGTTATGAPTAAELAQAGIGGQSAGSVAMATPAPMNATLPAGVPPANPQVAETPSYYPQGTEQPAIDNAGISDEQSFQAVSSRETIESDKERIARNRAAYEQVQPTAVPERTDASEPAVDLVQYALPPNRLGEAVYARSKLTLSNSQKACARFATPEAAQQAFLKSGGPKRDPKNLDPDGDGFACYWDPTPFQQAKN